MKKLGLIFLAFVCTLNMYALEKIKIGVLSFGTVNWELETLKHNKLDEKNGFELEVVKLASKNAVAIALQAKEVDMIVSDFIWTSRQRAEGADFTFYPYSKATGALYVRPDLNINSLDDISDKNIGISGGPVSKTWLIFRAYTQAKYNKDFKDMVKPTFASPPLLNKKVLDTSLDGAINFWHFNAKLEAKGMKRLIGVEEILPSLGIKTDVPLIGWVFSDNFAKKNKDAINGFLQASYETKKILATQPKQWDRLRPKMRAKSDKVFTSLKNGYIAGIPKKFTQDEIASASKIFDILAAQGGKKLVGKSKTLQDGTFWEFKPNIQW